MSEPLAVSINEAAHRIGVGRSTCYQLINNGELPSIVVGERRRVVPVRSLEEYVRRATGDVPDLEGDPKAVGEALLARHSGNIAAALGELVLSGQRR